jgi:CBS domain-containing protein
MTDLLAKDIMTPDPITVGPELSVTEAAHVMSERHVGALPVVDKGRMVGFVTEGDLIMQDARVHFPTYLSLLGGYVFVPGASDKFEAALRKAVAASVDDVMTREPVTVTPDALVTDVATLMVERDIARVPVMNGDTVVGIISKSDIVRSLVG